MRYSFECKKCKKKQSIECAMKDYDKLKESFYCKCGGQLKRVFEPFTGAVEIKGTKYGIDGGKGWIS